MSDAARSPLDPQVRKFRAWVGRHPLALNHINEAARRGQAPADAWEELWQVAMRGEFRIEWMVPAPTVH